MRKYNNPRLLNTVVSGTGMLHPVKPHVIVSDTVSEFVKGDLMDANAISELVDQKIGSAEGATEADVTELRQALAEEAAARTSADQTLDERITDLSTSIPQAISDGVAQIVAGADADYDTLKEISDYIKSDKTGAAQLSTAINNNTTAIDNESTRAQAKEAELEAAIDTKAAQSTTYTKAEVDTLVNSVDVSEQLANYYTKSEIDNAGYLTEHQDISNKADKSELFSGDYNDLTNKPTIPTIPTNVSEFTNDAGYITQHQDISGKANTSDLAAVATSGSYNDLDDKPTIPTVPTNVSSFTNDANYQTQQQVDDRFTALINAAPAALDTLGEIATKLADNDDAVSAIVTSISDEIAAREAADTAITTNITELASTVSANDTAINNKVDALETSLEDRISDVEDAMPTKVSDLKNDSGQTLNTLQAHEFYRVSNLSMTGSVNTYASSGSGPYTMSSGSKYRVTVDNLDPEIVTSTMNGDNVRIESSQTVTYDSREFPVWYFETNPYRALSIAIWHGSESQQVGAITKSHNILIEELTQPTIDSKYIPSDFVNRTEFNQSVADLQSSIETKLPTATFDSTAVSHFENDSNYLTAKIPEWSVGDYLYSDKTVSSELDTNKTVIGVLVAPASHFDDGKARFVALQDGDTVTLEDIPTDYVYNNVVKYNSSTQIYDTLDVSSDDSKVGGFYAWGFKAPDQAWQDKKGNYVNGSYYYTSASLAQVFKRVVPAPYNQDGTKNTNYYSLGTNNILSILRETGDDWYIPTPREFGYLIYSRNIINQKISNAGGVQIEYSYSATPYATSAIVNSQGSQVIFGVSRRYGDFQPASTAITRQFIAIKQPTEYQFDVNGESVDVVTLNSISTVATTGSYNDLVDKPTIPTVPTNVSAFQNDSGYLTQHQSLDNYYTKAEVDSSQQAQNTEISSKADKSTTYTKTETNELLANKANSADLATVATTGSYNDLTNKPTIPAAQIQSDWNQTDTSAKDYIKNKPTKVSELQNDAEYLSLAPNANGHEYVDLGLPSGTLWATMNVGASSETDYGNYYQYGKGAAQYSATSGDSNYSGTEDPLDSSVDTAVQVWGGSWHMPTRAQMQELTANTTYEWTTINGVNGGKFTATNGNYVFFPAAGFWRNGSHYNVGNNGFYWGSSPFGSNNAYYLDFYGGDNDVYYYGREYGYSVRGVLDSKQLQPVSFSGDYNDLANKPTIPTVWTGTQAEYDAIESPSASTIYFIKD